MKSLNKLSIIFNLFTRFFREDKKHDGYTQIALTEVVIDKDDTFHLIKR